MSQDQFAGKSILVVGAGNRQGIGFATARLLAERGAQVTIADIAQDQAAAMVGELPTPGAHAATRIDVTDEGSVDDAVKFALARHGRIDGLAIASGLYAGQSFLNCSKEIWERSFAINCTGAFLVAQAVARQMVVQRSGRIVVVASINGRQPQLTAAAYGSAKAALIQMVRFMALELAPYNITANTLCPGSTMTSMIAENPAGTEVIIKGNLEAWRLGIPLGRLAEPSDQAAAIAFLLSEEGRHITGQSLNVDGGQSFN